MDNMLDRVGLFGLRRALAIPVVGLAFLAGLRVWPVHQGPSWVVVDWVASLEQHKLDPRVHDMEKRLGVQPAEPHAKPKATTRTKSGP